MSRVVLLSLISLLSVVLVSCFVTEDMDTPSAAFGRSSRSTPLSPLTLTPAARPFPSALPRVMSSATAVAHGQATTSAQMFFPSISAFPLSGETPIPTATLSPVPSVVPRPTASPEEILIGPRDRRMLHIGFDVEGDPRVLYEILDVLAAEGYHTTFFLQGEWVKRHPEAVRRIAIAGHELGNHSWSHHDMRTMSAKEIEKELESTESLVVKLTGHSTKPFFRPPYGLRNALLRETAYQLHYTTVVWTFGGQDWVAGADEDSVYHNIVDRATPGAIFYLHTSHAFVPAAVRRAIRTLREEGYRLVSLSELLAGRAVR